MEQLNTMQKETETSNLLFVNHFRQLRYNPKIIMKLILSIVISILMVIVSTFATDFSKIYKETGISSSQPEQMERIGKIISMIGGSISAIVMMGVIFTVFLLISKIMNTSTSVKSIFSATLSYILITSIVGLIVNLIQLCFGLSINDYSLTSLNIFDKGNPWLGAIDLQTIFSVYVFGIMLYATNNFSKKATLIWSIVYLIIMICFSFIETSFS
ncbi:MAG: YIP1 family protein [Staphylococcus warneri]|uniref:YIP1 family protein n=2 Tax=Staphylococcus TaxID=1279 RepID=UPI00024E1E4A|nr:MULTISPECIES: YIP1 family protein [Staphylococcus]MDU0852705.1 YIP1 family protein [Veillonella sp.]MDU1788569.1 YIP1 family protein [Streptococcus thermophilus]MDU1965216.1 YIP1 family protein [Staphylococcus lugdunensis]MDU2291054.1 YIP1 family protein [Clostridium celatum]MDU7073406.1 YIP1 family protein [Staphylococcus sp.]